LTRLVDDLLDVSRISRNKLEMRKAGMDLNEAVHAALEAARPLLDHNAHRLTVSLPSRAVPVQGDLIRLTQVFTNLLNNSAKYTPKGGQVSLTVQTEGDFVSVRVKDTGQGIQSDNLPQLFQMFYRGSDFASYTGDGFGIGLTLAARIVELHGGWVEAYSSGPNAGSEFTVRLPIDMTAPDTKPMGEAAKTENGAGAIRRVLVADDNVDSADSLAMLLHLQGYEVKTAHDGPDALQAALNFIPDAVLLDIGMPGMNGYDVASRIREQPWGHRVLLIAQTGWGQERDRDASRNAGFDAHLTKPLDYNVLMELLSKVVHHERPAKTSP
jgi:CheY-like chemotaxis protein